MVRVSLLSNKISTLEEPPFGLSSDLFAMAVDMYIVRAMGDEIGEDKFCWRTGSFGDR